MESRAELKGLSSPELRAELEKHRKRLNDLLVAFPDLEKRPVSLTAQYVTRGSSLEEWSRTRSRIDELKLELFRRDEKEASSESVPETMPANDRKSFVIPILNKKGWSILDWAGNSGVDFHTANNYLKGKTKPYKSTRTKLAASLGVEVQRLPD
jgi:lambda repressor-like predicted transcriptional regulator